MLIGSERVGVQSYWCCNIGTLRGRPAFLSSALPDHVDHGSYINELRDFFLLALSNIWWMFRGISSKSPIRRQWEFKSEQHYSLRLSNSNGVRKFTFPRRNVELGSQFTNIGFVFRSFHYYIIVVVEMEYDWQCRIFPWWSML